MGALTSKPYAFSARPWELDHVDSFDFFDILGSSIRLDFRGPVLMRVLPRINSSLNEDWISDKVRFSLVDALGRQRVTKVYLVNSKHSIVSSSWFQVSKNIKTKKNYNCSFLIGLGPFVDLEFCVNLKHYIVNSFGLSNDPFSVFLAFFSYPNHDWRFDFLFSVSQLQVLEQSTLIIFCGFNPNAIPVLNIRFRRIARNNINNSSTLFFSFGTTVKFDYEVTNVGSTWQSFLKFVEGQSKLCATLQKFRNSKIVMIVGDEFYSAFSSFIPNSLLDFLRSKFVFLSILYLPYFSSLPNFLETGVGSKVSFENHFPFMSSFFSHYFSSFLSFSSTSIKTVQNLYASSPSSVFTNFYNFGHEFVSFYKNKKKSDCSTATFYSISHANNCIQYADYVLPSSAPFEKVSSFINITGLLQTSRVAFVGPSEVRSDWEILTMLLFWNGGRSFSFLNRSRVLPVFFRCETGGKPWSKRFNRPPFLFLARCTVNVFLPISFRNSSFDYYLSDYISRTSPLMALRSKMLKVFSIF